MRKPYSHNDPNDPTFPTLRSDFSDLLYADRPNILLNSIHQKTENSTSHAVDRLHLKIDSKTSASDFSDFTIRLFRLTGAGEGSDDTDLERIQPQKKALYHFGMNLVGSIEQPAGKIRVFSFDKIQNRPTIARCRNRLRLEQK